MCMRAPAVQTRACLGVYVCTYAWVRVSVYSLFTSTNSPYSLRFTRIREATDRLNVRFSFFPNERSAVRFSVKWLWTSFTLIYHWVVALVSEVKKTIFILSRIKTHLTHTSYTNWIHQKSRRKLSEYKENDREFAENSHFVILHRVFVVWIVKNKRINCCTVSSAGKSSNHFFFSTFVLPIESQQESNFTLSFH